MILPREFIVYEYSQIFNRFFIFQIRQRIGLEIKDANRRGKGTTFLIRAEDNKNWICFDLVLISSMKYKHCSILSDNS